MKTLKISTCLLFIFLGNLKAFAQMPDSNSTVLEWMHYIHDNIDDSASTGILLDKALMDSSYFNYRGLATDSVCKREIWYEMYNSLSNAGFDSLPPLDSVYKIAGDYIN